MFLYFFPQNEKKMMKNCSIVRFGLVLIECLFLWQVKMEKGNFECLHQRPEAAKNGRSVELEMADCLFLVHNECLLTFGWKLKKSFTSVPLFLFCQRERSKEFRKGKYKIKLKVVLMTQNF
jgi:hypothetical protein